MNPQDGKTYVSRLSGRKLTVISIETNGHVWFYWHDYPDEPCVHDLSAKSDKFELPEWDELYYESDREEM